MKASARWGAAIVLIFATCLLAGCYLPTRSAAVEVPTDTPTNPPVATSPPVAEEITIPEPEAGEEVLWTDFSYVVYVPEGEFIMGKDENPAGDHSPAHTVLLEDFWIQQTEVTNRMYARCVALGICSPPHHEAGIPYRFGQSAHGSDPVVGVDWTQAQDYCEWIKGSLPTEAQWEKAARATEAEWLELSPGTETGPYPYPYPWGDDEPSCELLNFAGCLDPGEPEHVRAYPLGASLYNAADLAGNVSEWILDIYDADAYSPIPTPTPTGVPYIETRVVRGSNYESPAGELAVFLRDELKPAEHSETIGFRCVLSGDAMDDPPPSACEEAAMYIPPLEELTAIPHAPPEIRTNTFCNTSPNGTQFAVVNLIFSEPVLPEEYNITSSVGTPVVSYEPALPNILSVSGLPLEMAFQLTVCPALAEAPALPTNPECSPGYQYDPLTQLCYFGHNPDHPYMCGGGALNIPGFGCLPEPSGGSCPVGYFLGEYEGNPVCIPVGIPDLYTLTDCLEGMVLDPENTCCELPPGTYEPVCPPGYALDPTGWVCLPGYEEETCQTIDFYIPDCPPVQLCTNPGSYLSESTCEAAHCYWQTSPTGGKAYCRYP